MFISFSIILKLYFDLILVAEQDILPLSLPVYAERSLFILSVFLSNFILCCIRNRCLLAFCNTVSSDIYLESNMDFIPLVCLNINDFCAEENTIKKYKNSFVHIMYSNCLFHLMLSIYSHFIHMDIIQITWILCTYQPLCRGRDVKRVGRKICNSLTLVLIVQQLTIFTLFLLFSSWSLMRVRHFRHSEQVDAQLCSEFCPCCPFAALKPSAWPLNGCDNISSLYKGWI